MNNYRNREPLPSLIFDKNRSRVKYCPCGKDNGDVKFAPYVGYENKGYCHSCGDFFLPDLTGHASDHFYQKQFIPMNKPKPASHVSVNVFKQSLAHYERNHFVLSLTNQFGEKITNKLIESYFIGTSKHWQGATYSISSSIPRLVRRTCSN